MYQFSYGCAHIELSDTDIEGGLPIIESARRRTRCQCSLTYAALSLRAHALHAMLFAFDAMLLPVQLEGLLGLTLAHAFFDFDFHHLPTLAAAYRMLLRKPAVRIPLKLWLVAGPLMIRCNSALQKENIVSGKESLLRTKEKTHPDSTFCADLARQRPFSRIPSPPTPSRREKRPV